MNRPPKTAPAPAESAAAKTAPWSAEQRLGDTIRGRYRLMRVIGRGGSGATYAAHDVELQRDVAVKVMLPRDVTGSEGIDSARFIQEGRIASRVRHPNIVDVFDLGTDEHDLPFLVMELLEGETLHEAQKAHGAFSVEDAFRFMLPLMGAVAFAHDRNVLHRDLKPSNIFLSRDLAGRVVPRLLDFGVAKVADAATLTRSGTVVGTPSFMSPEQALDESLTPASDVWSLGVIWFLALSAKLPFNSDNLTSTLLKIVNTEAPKLSTVAPSVPRHITYAIDRALRRDPSKRYADVREFARTLLSAAISDGVAVPEDPEPIGLPDFKAWRLAIQSEPATMETPKTVIVASTTPKQEEAPKVETAPTTDVVLQAEPAPKSRTWMAVWGIVLLALAALAITAVLMRGSRSSDEAKAIFPAPNAVQQSAPAEKVTAPPAEKSSAKDPVVAPASEANTPETPTPIVAPEVTAPRPTDVVPLPERKATKRPARGKRQANDAPRGGIELQESWQ